MRAPNLRSLTCCRSGSTLTCARAGELEHEPRAAIMSTDLRRKAAPIRTACAEQESTAARVQLSCQAPGPFRRCQRLHKARRIHGLKAEARSGCSSEPVALKLYSRDPTELLLQSDTGGNRLTVPARAEDWL